MIISYTLKVYSFPSAITLLEGLRLHKAFQYLKLSDL